MANEDRNPREPLESAREEIKPMTGIVSEVVTSGYGKVSEQVASNHHETPAQKSDSDRRVYADNPAPRVPAATPLRVDKPQRHDTLDLSAYGRDIQPKGQSYMEILKEKNKSLGLFAKIKVNPAFGIACKVVAAGGLTFVLVGSFMGCAGYINPHPNLEKSSLEQSDEQDKESYASFMDADGTFVELYGEDAEAYLAAEKQYADEYNAPLKDFDPEKNTNNEIVNYGIENNYAPMSAEEQEASHSKGAR